MNAVPVHKSGRAGLASLSLLLLGACATAVAPPPVPWAFARVRYLAIVTQPAAEAQWGPVAERLEALLGQLLVARVPSLQLVERRALARVLEEQALAASGQVSDATAVGVGRLVGADGLLVLDLSGPRLVELLLMPHAEQLPPVQVTLKLLAVETGAVLWLRTLKEPVQDTSSWIWRDPLRASAVRAAWDRLAARLPEALTEPASAVSPRDP
jgi:hypothetical protein